MLLQQGLWQLQGWPCLCWPACRAQCRPSVTCFITDCGVSVQPLYCPAHSAGHVQLQTLTAWLQGDIQRLEQWPILTAGGLWPLQVWAYACRIPSRIHANSQTHDPWLHRQAVSQASGNLATVGLLQLWAHSASAGCWGQQGSFLLCLAQGLLVERHAWPACSANCTALLHDRRLSSALHPSAGS